MPGLRDTQRAFAEGLVDGHYRAAAAMIAPEESALRSVALYRRLIRGNYTQVLKVTYPVLHRLVGDRDFAIMARGYLKQHPSTSGDLFPYGRHVPAFLRQVGAPPLLVEMARLEWACHEAHQSADVPPLSRDHLQTLATADPARATVQLHPASRLLLFPFPLHRVWLALQPSEPAAEIELPLPAEETGVVVMRRAGKIQVTALARPDYRLLDAVTRGVDLASVERMALEDDPEFDFARFVADMLRLQLLTGVSVGGSR